MGTNEFGVSRTPEEFVNHFFVLDFFFFEFGEQVPVNQVPVDVWDAGKLQGHDAKFVRLGVVGVGGLRCFPRWRRCVGLKNFFVLLCGGMNGVGDVFVGIVDADFFNEVEHNFFCLFVVTVSGEKDSYGSTVNVMTISGESFLPEVN